MIDWGTFAATVVGGALAIAGSVVTVSFARRRDTEHWYRELQVNLAGETLAALQGVVRELVTLAYAETPGYQTLLQADGEGQGTRDVYHPAREVMSEVYRAMTLWNSSMHRLSVSSPRQLVSVSRQMDDELGRLLDLAVERRWTRDSFRAERKHLGQLMAEFIDESRALNKAQALEMENAWTWHDRSV